MRAPKANEVQNPQLTKHDSFLPLLVLFLSNAVGVDGQDDGLADAPRDCSATEAFPPRTVLTENICRCVQHILLTFPDNKGLFNSLHNNLFLPGFSSSPG